MFLSVLLAFVLDKLFAEPSRHHPLVYFGRMASRIEQALNTEGGKHPRYRGVLAALIVMLPLIVLSIILEYYLKLYTVIYIPVAAIIIYIAVGWQSLIQHAENIRTPLMQCNIDAARASLAMIVSRDTSELDEKAVAKAATESVLENGADAIFSAIFWFCILGIPGVVLYRLSNTLDAMWGYKNTRFVAFGWFAARLDDVLNYIPARLTALSYAIVGHRDLAVYYWRKQGGRWKSPNAGPVMAAGAGALNTSLGGAAYYHGHLQHRPVLGPEESASTTASFQTIGEACRLVNKALCLWLLAIALLSLMLSI